MWYDINKTVTNRISHSAIMPNYANGKIYAIRSRSRLDLVYIGSTTQQLSKRYAEHVQHFRHQKKMEPLT